MLSISAISILKVTIYPNAHSVNASLICQVAVTNGVVVPIILTLIKVNGLDSTILSKTVGNASTYALGDLSQEDSAEYICVANISLPSKGISNSSSDTTEICLIRKLPIAYHL